VAVRGPDVVAVPIEEATSSIRGVPEELYNTARTFYG
jgi:hypothetical protein